MRDDMGSLGLSGDHPGFLDALSTMLGQHGHGANAVVIGGAAGLAESAQSQWVTQRLRETCHDIRQPVAAVLSLAATALTEPCLPDVTRSYLEQISTLAQSLADVVHQSLRADEHAGEEARHTDLAPVDGAVKAPPTGSLRLVLCDDHQILAQALAAVLQARGHQVLSVTTDPAAGVAAVAAYDPDICILDVYFPGRDSGLKAAQLIRQHHPRTKVLMLSDVADTQALAEAEEIGVAGFIPKDQGVDEIAEALQVVATGGAVFGRGLPHRGLSPGVTKPQSNDPFDALAPREKEVLARIVEGQSTKQMARAMSISSGTVRMYVRKVLTALDAHSRLEVAAIARREGMLNRLQAGGANLTRAG